ncbi:MAG: rod shape-determining protein MreD [Reichenbachiella sp.]
MDRFGPLGGLIGAVLIFFLQVLVLKGIVLYEYAFCFAYIIIFLQLPIDTNPLIQLILAFIIGLAVDAFYNTLGIHAAASTFMIFLKIFWINALTPSGGYDSGAKINVRTQGLQWFFAFSYPLVLAHSIFLFFTEAASINLLWMTFGKAFYSSILTFIMVLIIQYLFYKKMK